MTPFTITFVTTCKNRLHHLKETLALLSKQAEKDIVVVDYSCPQNTAQWVSENHPHAKVVQVLSEGFNISHARNCGAEKITSDFICFIDADVKVKPGFMEWIHENLSPYCFYTLANKTEIDPQLWGTTIVPSKALRFVAGYDEIYCGWGGEDDDLYYRLKTAGFYPRAIPPQFLEAIRHGDEERVQFHEIKDKYYQHYINRMYSTAKKQVMSFYRAEGELPYEIRKKIYDVIFETAKTKSKQLEITIDINLSEQLSNKHRLAKRLSLKLNIVDGINQPETL